MKDNRGELMNIEELKELKEKVATKHEEVRRTYQELLEPLRKYAHTYQEQLSLQVSDLQVYIEGAIKKGQLDNDAYTTRDAFLSFVYEKYIKQPVQMHPSIYLEETLPFHLQTTGSRSSVPLYAESVYFSVQQKEYVVEWRRLLDAFLEKTPLDERFFQEVVSEYSASFLTKSSDAVFWMILQEISVGTALRNVDAVRAYIESVYISLDNDRYVMSEMYAYITNVLSVVSDIQQQVVHINERIVEVFLVYSEQSSIEQAEKELMKYLS